MKSSFYARIGKRWLDVAGASLILVIASPLLILAAFAIWLTDGSPILFRQVRVGQFGRPFEILKFRTMTPGASADDPRITATGDPRITRTGRILRKTKIDELPQLLNVLRGEMSLVGPRPEVPGYVARYTPLQNEILQLKPGITGMAAIAYRNEEELLEHCLDAEALYLLTIMPAKLELDLAYRKRIGFTEDVRLILRTILRLFEQHRPGPLPTQEQA